MTAHRYYVDNRAGWHLSVTRHATTSNPLGRPKGRPVLIVPGYGMNSFIFTFHPNGESLVGSLVARGLEVWTVDLRGQGQSRKGSGHDRYGLADLAVEDIGAVMAHVLAHTETRATKLDLVGASLGTALSFAHIALTPEAKVHALVSMAGLVTWRTAHPLVRLAFRSPTLAGWVRIKHTRRLARFALPTIAKVAPSLLSIYLNHRSTDLSQSAKMVESVEDPHPIINREIAEWIRRGDLVIRGVNVSARLPGMTHPFMCIVANDDGIVLPATSRHTFDMIGSSTKEILFVGDEHSPIAHADLFVCNDAERRVFAPIADFLLRA
jgi:pimeloyl-ACP methyl ester carboxylesterase